MKFSGLVGKELRGYFFAPTAYVAAAAFLLMSGWLFSSSLFLINRATMQNFFGFAPLLLAFFAPAVTARLFAEEAKTGTLELLLSLPASESLIVAAKFIAALTVVAATLALTAPYAVTVAALGRLDGGATLLGYAGLFAVAAMMTAFGTLASASTRSQVVAFILGFSACLTVWLLGKAADVLPFGAASVADALGIDSHLAALARGTFDFRDVLYFAGGIWLALVGARLRLIRCRR